MASDPTGDVAIFSDNDSLMRAEQVLHGFFGPAYGPSQPHFMVDAAPAARLRRTA